MSAGDWRAARIAAELVRNVLAQHDWQALISEGTRSDAIAPIMDPTLYRERGHLVREDLEVFRAAARFLATWGDRALRPADGGDTAWLERAHKAEEEAAGLRARLEAHAAEPATRATILRPARSEARDAGPEDFDRRIWIWRTEQTARARVFRTGLDLPSPVVEDLHVGIEHPIRGFPCSLDMLNTILGDTRVVALPGVEVRICFAEPVDSCAVAFEVIR